MGLQSLKQFAVLGYGFVKNLSANCLVPKVPNARENHCHSGGFGGGNGF